MNSPETVVHLHSVVQHVQKRQLGGLGTILQLVKGVLPDTGGAASSIPSGTSGTTTPVATGPASGVAVDSSCVDAIAKIDDALQLSESFMKASGGRPTLKDIQVVLKTLEDSLSAECKTDRHQRRNSRMQDHGAVNDEDNAAYLKDIFMANNMQEAKMHRDSESQDVSMDNKRQRMVRKRSNILSTRRETCSECERALYNIVKELQSIFSIGQAAAESDATGVGVKNTTTESA